MTCCISLIYCYSHSKQIFGTLYNVLFIFTCFSNDFAARQIYDIRTDMRQTSDVYTTGRLDYHTDLSYFDTPPSVSIFLVNSRKKCNKIQITFKFEGESNTV